MSKVGPVVEQAVEELGLNRVTRRRLLGGVGLTSASPAPRPCWRPAPTTTTTRSIGQVAQKYSMRDKGLKVAGGFDRAPETLDAINGGSLDYTIDQQPCLQGFLPVLYTSTSSRAVWCSPPRPTPGCCS